MSSAAGGSPRGPSSSGRSGSTGRNIVLIVLGMAVLFAAGFGASRLFGSSSSGGSSAAPTSTPTPCVTTTVVPGKGLPKPKSVTLNVYNSTTTAGLARKTALSMKTRGFAIGKVANDPKGNVVTGVAEVRHGPSGLKAAQLVAFYVPGAALVDDGRTTADVDLAVGPSFTAVATDQQVAAALVKPSPSVSPPGCGASSPPPAPTSASPAAT